MARKRFIKPGFFCNEDLAELPFEYRILFQGLWCWADRDGRLEDRPKRLKSQIFPYDEVDVNAGLDLLVQHGFIIRYVTKVNNVDFKAIQILKFKEHQDVHKNETESIIPKPAIGGTDTENIGTSTPLTLDLELDTLDSKPVLEVEEISRENEIAEAIENFINPEQQNLEEKEKNSAQKEKVLPILNMAIEGLEQTHLWKYSLEHYKITDVERQALFKIFYEQKESVYLKFFPPWDDMASNFYFWIPKSKHLYQQTLQNGNSITKATGKQGNRYQQSKDDVTDLMQQSADFLQQSTG